MLATTVDFLKESGQVLLVMTGPLTDAIRIMEGMSVVREISGIIRVY